MKKRKILEKVLSGSKNIRFQEFVALLVSLGFALDRTEGSHQVFTHPLLPRPFPVQNAKGKAKPYQVRQLAKFIEMYNLSLSNEDEESDE